MMSFTDPRRSSAPQPTDSKPELPCSACNTPTTKGADIDRNDGRGWVRYPVCDVGCLEELLSQFGVSLGSQVCSRYPSVEDQF